MDNAPIGMSVVDNGDRMVRVNAALGRFLGCSEADLLDRTWKEPTHPEDLTVGAPEIAAVFAGERRTHDEQAGWRRRHPVHQATRGSSSMVDVDLAVLDRDRPTGRD